MGEIREGEERGTKEIEGVSLGMRWCVGSSFLTASLGFMSK